MRTATLSSVLALAVITLVSFAATAEAGGHHIHRTSVRWHNGHVQVHHRAVVGYRPLVVYRPAPVVFSTPAIATTPPVVTVRASYRPVNCHWNVCVGETLYSIAEAQYGNGNLWTYVARYNGISDPAQFRVGLQVELPVIYSNGSMRRSTSPAPAPVRPQLAGTTVANF